MGGDVKYRIAPNLTLDATINPDFGQVEADPAVLNLSAYESFFDERRPFFVAGRGLFRFDVNCSAGELQRRRTSTTAVASDERRSSRASTATPFRCSRRRSSAPAKLIGRFPAGLTVGVLDAVTQRETSPGDTTYEPATNFAVMRATQDLRKGNSSDRRDAHRR